MFSGTVLPTAMRLFTTLAQVRLRSAELLLGRRAQRVIPARPARLEAAALPELLVRQARPAQVELLALLVLQAQLAQLAQAVLLVLQARLVPQAQPARRVPMALTVP